MRNIDFAALPSPVARYCDEVLSDYGHKLGEHVTAWYEAIALRQAEEREIERRGIDTLTDWQKERELLRSDFQAALGMFPDHEVEVRQCGVVEHPDAIIRKLMFSALPDHWVPANLYLPRNTGSVENKLPAILSPCGHGILGKTAYIKRALRLARNGYAVITFDFIGTGERQIVHHRQALYPVSTQHNMVGLNMPLMSCTMGWFMLQETMAAVTVLQQQEEIDPEAIGITGSSGGGWTTVHAAALDDRIKVAVPAAAVCSFRYEVLPDDAEQVMFGMQRRGLHYADFMSFLICPRPLFVVANSRDIWGLDGTSYAYNEAKRLYELHGCGERIAMEVWDKGHAYEDDQLEIAIGWFNRWLRGCSQEIVSGAADESLPDIEHLLVTDEQNIFASGYARPSEIFTALGKPARKPPDRQSFLSEMRAAVGRRRNAEPSWRALDRFIPGVGLGRRIVFSPEPGLLLPVEIMIPDNPEGITVLIDAVDRRSDYDWQIEVMRRGQIVLRPDLRGWGETSPDESWADWEGYAQRLYSGKYAKLQGLARLTGRNLVLDRAFDLLTLLDVAGEMFARLPISVWGRRQGALPALYAAVCDERIEALTLESFLSSYRDLLANEIACWTPEGDVEGILAADVDIVDLLREFKGELKLIKPLDAVLAQATLRL